jgi:hypothetical protein
LREEVGVEVNECLEDEDYGFRRFAVDDPEVTS